MLKLSFTSGRATHLGFYATEVDATKYMLKFQFYTHLMEVIALGDDIPLPKYVVVGRPWLLDDRTPL